jgi:cyclophilin family peptidyl-prolyl cis-trans isomerase
MQQELDSENPELAISILGVNELGHDSDNSLMTAGRDLPWLQDIDDGGDGNSDTWNSWDVTFRDVIITDSNNVQVTAYNLTNNDLANADNFATLKQLLIAAASATPGIATIADQTLTAGSPLHIPLNGFDPAGGQLPFTVERSDPLVSAEVLTGNRSLRMQVDDFGAMTFELFETRTPRATAQIIELAESGFYDGTIFHRVIDNFVIQGGDPTGTGAGGSTLGDFDDQYHVDLQYNRTGLIGMAKTTDDTNDSQFFITEGPIRHLDFNYSIFGVLTEGEDVRAAISDVATDGGGRPLDPVVLHEVEIFEDIENGVLMLSAAEGSSGSATITVTVSDSLGNQASRSFEATVVTDLDPSANGNPFLDDIAPVRMEANSTTSFTLTAQDAEGDAVEFLGEDELSAILFSSQIPTLPTELVYSVDATTGVVIVTASDNLIGEHQVRVGVRKPGTVGNDSTIDSQLVSITLGVITVDANDHSSGTQASDGTPDTISLRRNGTDYNVSVNGEIVRTIDESLVHAIDLVGSSDDDLFEIDCSNGPPVMPGGVVITGGSQQTADGDSLSLHTGSFLSVTHRFTDASSGTITLETNAPISYSGLEPISDTLLANDRVFEFGNGDDQVTVGDDSDNANGISRISSIASSGTVDFQMTPGGRIVIRGGNGNDQITAGDLDPTVSTSLTVSGDSGNDTIDASAMTDQVTLLGGGGADKLVGGSNNDKLRGQGGSLDTLTGGPGNDTLDGGSGYDQVSESQDSDFAASNTELVGAGTDTLNDIQVLSLTGGASNNTFDGSAFTGRLFLNGRGGQDTLIGGGGNDKLNGGIGNDSLVGGGGDDVLTGESGNDTIDGGDGTDRLYERSNVDMTLTDASLSGGMGSDVLTSIEVAYLKGGNGDNLLDASAFSGDVTLIGVGGNDTLKGGSGNDMLNGRSGADSMTGGDGDDTLKGMRGKDTLNGGAGNDRLEGGTQDDAISGWTGRDLLIGSSGNDTLVGGWGHDTLWGNAGDDVAIGDDGRDETVESEDGDFIDAGDGADTVRGGGGSDMIKDHASEVDENFTYWADWVDAV